MRTRQPLYSFEREKVESLGYCDEEIPCSLGFSVVHRCGRAKDHGGRCAARTWLNGHAKVEKL
jgi:hypothetical protein